jgi:hypothetical protein
MKVYRTIENTQIINSICDVISNSFDNVLRPLDESIVEPSFENDIERRDLVIFLSGKTWRDLKLETLLNYKHDHTAILSFLTPLGFQYFLPAFLFICIHNFEDADFILDSTFLKFEKPNENNFERNSFLSWLVSELTQRQLSSVKQTAEAIEKIYGQDEFISNAIAGLNWRLNNFYKSS